MVQSESLDSLFRALADPTRRAIVDRLVEGSCSVSELAGPFDMTLTAVQKHLRVLQDAGVIACDKPGRVRTCRLQRAAFDQAASWIEDRRQLWEGRLDRLEAHVTDGDDQ